LTTQEQFEGEALKCRIG